MEHQDGTPSPGLRTQLQSPPLVAQALNKPCCWKSSGVGERTEANGPCLCCPALHSVGVHGPTCTGTVLGTETRLCRQYMGWSQCSWDCEGKERQAPESAIDHGAHPVILGQVPGSPASSRETPGYLVPNNVADLHLLGRENHQHPRFLKVLHVLEMEMNFQICSRMFST